MHTSGSSDTDSGIGPDGAANTQRAISLIREYERFGDERQLQQAIGMFRAALAVTPRGDPGHVAYLVNLGIALEQQFKVTGEPGLLTEALQAARDALAAAPTGHADRAACLSRLGSVLREKFEITGEPGVLAEAVQAARDAVAAAPASSADRARYLSNLGIALHATSMRTGEPGPLAEAVQVAREAVALAPAGDPHRANYLAVLGSCLSGMAGSSSDASLLAEAVQAVRDAVAATGPGHPSRARYLSNLGTALHAMSMRTGEPGPLAEAVQVAREAVAATPPGHPGRAICLSNLGASLLQQFLRTGDTGMLTEAVQVERDALAATPADHPRRARSLSDLTVALLELSRRSGDVGLLAEAVQVARQAVAATAADDPERASCLSRLGIVLLRLFERTEDTGMLTEAVQAAREAVAAPAAGVGRVARLTNLGNALQMLFKRTRELSLLTEIVQVRQDAVAATPADHPDRAPHLGNLADSLREAGQLTGQPELLARARACFLEAGASTAANISTRISAYKQAALIPPTDDADATASLAAMEAAIRLMPQVASRLLMRSDRENRLVGLGPIADNAVAVALNAGRPERAVELLEQARGVLVADLLDADDSEVRRLRDRHPDMAAELDELRARLRRLDGPNLLASPDVSGADVSQVRAKEVALAATGVRQQASADWDAFAARVRAIPDFATFLQPPAIGSLARQANHGPIVFVSTSQLRCDALILTADTKSPVRVVPLGDLTQGEAYRQARRLMTACLVAIPGNGSARDDAEQEVLDVLAWLWDAVAGPVLDALGRAAPERTGQDAAWPRIWWSPAGVMASLPLHAAGHHTDLTSADPVLRARPRTVMDRVISSYAVTVRGLASARARQNGDSSPATLIVAVPDAPDVPPLPGIEGETRVLAALVPGAHQLARPTRQAVLDALPDHDLAHFACHGYTDWSNPDASYLALYDHAEAPLTVTDINALHLSAGLAFLSACESTLISPRLADEAVHITAAFHLVGYQHVIGTLWPINDSFARKLAIDIYRHLTREGTGPPDTALAPFALHRALRALRHRLPGAPSVWAGYIHTGGPMRGDQAKPQGSR